MKTIIMAEPKKVENGDISYQELIKGCLNTPPEGGFDVETMRNRIKIVDKVEKANGSLKLEDAEYGVLKNAVNAMRWAIQDQYIIDFHDAIIGAK